MNKSINTLISLSIMFFIVAVALSLAIWSDVSWSAKIGLFANGFISGAFAGQWIVKRKV